MWALKYRPRKLVDVLGQEVSKRLISGALLRRSDSRAWLTTGPHGTGKTTLVRIIAKGLICPHQTETGEGCGVCHSCIYVDQETSPNYTEVDAASFGSADRIRELVQEAQLTPTGEGRSRVIALDEVHALSPAAQDVLLKTLEETPPATHFILLTTNPEKLKGTVISRCLHIRLGPVDSISAVGHLENVCRLEGVSFEADALKLIVNQKYGHVRDGLTLAETISLTGDLTVAATKSYLGLDLRDEAYSLIEKALQNWEESLALGQSLCDHYDPATLWELIQSLLLEADFRRRAPLRVETDPAVDRLVVFLGAQLSNLSEWLLGKARQFTVTNYADLMVVLALALDQVGLVTQSDDVTTGFAALDNLGGLHRRAEGDPEIGEQCSYEDFLGTIGFIVDDSDD